MRKNNFRKNVSKLAFLLFAFIGAAQLMTTKNASALEDFASARANTAVKVIATDLGLCYENAQGTVQLSEDGITDFSGNKFWTSPEMKVTLPRVLYGKTGDKDNVTCTELITGWKTNWFVNLFTSDGKFSGLIKQDVTVPNNSGEDTIWLTDSEKASAKRDLQTYLKGVGYKEQESSSTTLNGYKCFYAKLKIPEKLFMDNGGVILPPLNGEHVFSSENVCLYVGSDGKVDYKNYAIWVGYDSIEEPNGESLYINRKNDVNNHIRLYSLYPSGSDYIAWNYDYGYSPIHISSGGIVVEYEYIEDYRFGDNNWVWFSVFDTPEDACPERMNNPYYSGVCNLLTNDNEEITYDEVKNRVKQVLENQVLEKNFYGTDSKVFSNVEIVDIDMDSVAVSYTKGNKRDFVKYFVDYDDVSVSLSLEEQYMFYYDHLKDYFKVDEYNNAGTGSENRVLVYWLGDDNTFSKKYIYSDNNRREAQPLCNASRYDPIRWCDTASKVTWRDFANKLAELSSDPEALAAAFENAGIIDTEYNELVEENLGLTPSGSTGTVDQCYQSAGSLGWFICPVMNTAAKAMLRMYNNVEQDFLVVESDLTSTNSMTRDAWSIFVNFANIAMVILLLVVIISQITGFGIDNYGIKKLLPKIITVALLVNLSFIICQLAVDISNIVGKSAKDLLVNTANSLTTSQIPSCSVVDVDCHNSAGWFKALMLIAGGGILGLGGIEIAQGILTGGMLDGLIIPILILVLVAVIAVIFFFILLGLRKAAIVILMVISPLAFICYALPNTKKLFTKWFDAMKGLLLLYPLCGLIIGGGTLASKIILSASQDYVTYFIGAIMMVVPFFMVPSLLKSSFKALGGIGAKISGLGKSLRTKTQARADKVHKNTTGYKARQADFANRVKVRQAKANNRRAGRTIERLEQKRASGKELSEMEQARLYDATNTANQYENARADYEVGVPKISQGIAHSRAESRLQAQETKLWSEQLAKAKTADIEKAFNESFTEVDTMGNVGNAAKMSAAFEALKNTGNLPSIHRALKNVDWSKMGDGMRLALNQSMIGSGDVAMKAYAKESFKHGNKGNFRNFMEGVDTDGLGTVQGALQKLGSHALDGQNKDTVDFIADHTGSLGNGDWVAKMIMSGLTSTQNGEEKAKFQKMLTNYKNQSSSGAEFAENIKKAVNASTLAKMDSGSFNELNKLLGGNSNDYSAINSVLGDTIRELQQADNATLYASLSNDIKDKLSTQPQVQEVRLQVQQHVQTQPQQTQRAQTPQSSQPASQPAPQSQPTQDEQGEIHVNFSGDGGMDG